MFITDSLSPAAMMGWCVRTEYHVSLLDTSMFPCKYSCDMNFVFFTKVGNYVVHVIMLMALDLVRKACAIKLTHPCVSRD